MRPSHSKVEGKMTELLWFSEHSSRCLGGRRLSQPKSELNEAQGKLTSLLLHLGERVISKTENNIEAISKILESDYSLYKDVILKILVAW
jgi:hypothetical protein